MKTPDETREPKRKTVVQLREALQYYEYYSERASTIVRQLGFAALALVWILRTGKPLTVPNELILPAGLAVGALAVDLVQYAWASFIWSHLHWERRSEGVEPDQAVTMSSRWDAPTTILFWGKLVLLGASYGMLLGYLWDHI